MNFNSRYYDGEPFGTPGCTRCGPCCGASQEHLARAECKKSGMGIRCSCAPNSQHLCAAGRWSDLVENCDAIHDNLTKYRHIHLKKKKNVSKIIKSRDIVATTPVGTTRTRRGFPMTDTSQNSTSVVTTSASSLHLEAKNLERRTKRTTATTKTKAAIKHKSPTEKVPTRRSYHEDSTNVTLHSSSTQQMKTNDNFTLPGNESVTGKSGREFLLRKISSTKATILEGSSDGEIPTSKNTHYFTELLSQRVLLQAHCKFRLSGNITWPERNILIRLAPSLFRQSKQIGKGKIRKGKSEIQSDCSQFTVSARLITDDEIDLGQVYILIHTAVAEVILGESKKVRCLKGYRSLII